MTLFRFDSIISYMTTIAPPIAEEVARPNVEEIERLMLLRGFTRRQRQGKEWILVPHWANLAREAGITPTTIYPIRDGESDPKLGTLGRIARALGVLARDIIDEEED